MADSPKKASGECLNNPYGRINFVIAYVSLGAASALGSFASWRYPCSMTPIRADWDAELSAEILEPCSLEATPPPCFHASTNRKADRRLSFDYRRAPRYPTG